MLIETQALTTWLQILSYFRGHTTTKAALS